MRVLVVEDNAALAANVGEFLEAALRLYAPELTRCPDGADWIVVDVELVQEQAEESDCGGCEGASGDYVSVVFAMWRVQEGFAAAVWNPGDHGTLALIMGFDPWAVSEGWQPCSVWYGE